MKNDNKKMFLWIKELFPFCRSLTGQGVDKTLNYIKSKIGININIIKFKTGKKFLIGRFQVFGM